MPARPRVRRERRKTPIASPLLRVLLAAVPAGRAELARGMAAEVRALPSGPERRQWLISTYLYTLREGRMTWIKLAVSGASTLFILWIAYNAIDSHFIATGPELASSVGMVVLLAATVAIVTPWHHLQAMLGRAPKPSAHDPRVPE